MKRSTELEKNAPQSLAKNNKPQRKGNAGKIITHRLCNIHTSRKNRGKNPMETTELKKIASKTGRGKNTVKQFNLKETNVQEQGPKALRFRNHSPT